jgi:type III pantothenate kinase
LLKQDMDRISAASDPPERICISSVVPDKTRWIIPLLHARCGSIPFVIRSDIQLGFDLGYDDPKLIGSDRIACIAAAKVMFDSSVLVVDLGTAVTLTLLNDEGNLEGGMIFPGFNLLAESLAVQTARLPKIEFEIPVSIIGNSTIPAIQSGLYYGLIGAVREMIQTVRDGVGYPLRVLGTGGWLRRLPGNSLPIDVYEPHLILHGLRILFDLNNRADSRN